MKDDLMSKFFIFVGVVIVLAILITLAQPELHSMLFEDGSLVMQFSLCLPFQPCMN